MSLSYLSLNDIIDPFLLETFAKDIGKVNCGIFSPSGDLAVTVGDPKKVPKLSAEKIKEISATPMPIDLPDGRAIGIYTKGEFLGFATVSTSGASSVVISDYVFQIIAYTVAAKLEREDLQFSAEYLKNLITLMQRLSQKTAAVFDRVRVAELFIAECQKLFGVRSAAVYAIDGNDTLRLATLGAQNDDQKAISQIMASRSLLATKTELAVPLTAGQELVGAICVRDKETGPFSVEDQRMAQTVAAVLGSTIGNIRLHENLVKNERVRATLSRYLSPNLVEELVEGDTLAKLGGKRVKTAVLFSDIRGFTKISEKVAPEQIVRQLNEYFEAMSRVIFKYDGTLDKYVGDLIMVLFGVPKPMEDSALRAVKTAIEMQGLIKAIQAQGGADNILAGGVGIGINIGEVVFGNIGSSQAMGLTVIGDNVNQAQRLEAYAGGGEIIVTESVHQEISKAGIATEKIGVVEVKGKQIVAYKVKY